MVPTDMVQTVLQQHDLFLLPTMGENYGHVIFEALSVGCIPIISDQTPWNIIEEKHAGFVCPLTTNMEYFVRAFNTISNMDGEDIFRMSENAVSIARDKVEQAKRETGYRVIFG